MPQGRSIDVEWDVAIRFEVVGIQATARGLWVHAGSTRTVLELRGYGIASANIFGPMRSFLEPTTEFYMYEYLYPFHCIQSWFRLSDCSLTSQATSFADESCETNRSLVGTEKLLEDLEEFFFHTVRSHVASFNVSPVWLGTLRGRPPNNGVNWQRRASHE